ncbi:hypothetical protein COCOBI_09-0300 [Coccomyxa sp. Obi]|nr:hypothetical protein COCOBI_09-0300 [Coccomyxa sp. Obi]
MRATSGVACLDEQGMTSEAASYGTDAALGAADGKAPAPAAKKASCQETFFKTKNDTAEALPTETGLRLADKQPEKPLRKRKVEERASAAIKEDTKLDAQQGDDSADGIAYVAEAAPKPKRVRNKAVEPERWKGLPETAEGSAGAAAAAESTMLAAFSADGQPAVWDLAVERDPEEEAALAASMNAASPEDLPGQLLFVHLSQLVCGSN